MVQLLVFELDDVLVKMVWKCTEVDVGTVTLLSRNSQTTPDGKSLTHKMRISDQGYYELFNLYITGIPYEEIMKCM